MNKRTIERIATIGLASIEEETRYSVCAEEAFRLYLKARKEKEKRN